MNLGRARVVATLGPATDHRVGELLDAGVDVFRLNFSHGTAEEHLERIRTIRRVAGGRSCAILQDLAGPKLRLTHPVGGDVGDVVEVELPETVRRGDPVLLADGVMQLEVVDARHARVVVAGRVPAGKGINLPSSRLDLPSLTEKDRSDLRLGIAEGVDAVALSFVSRAADLDEARTSGVPIFAKIERAEAIARLDEIVAAADGILVARGDLGVEIPLERVPVEQKRVIALANRFAKPVITATQMLRSMVDSPMPTRAEATDVANALLDGTDAVMLSEETAIGAHPVAAVSTMQRILAQAVQMLEPRLDLPREGVAEEIAHAACALALRIGARAIVVGTRTGRTARLVSRHRPSIPILALTPHERIRRQLSFVWGVTASAVPWYDEPESVLHRFREPLRASALVPPGAPVVVVAVWPLTSAGHTNLLLATTS